MIHQHDKTPDVQGPELQGPAQREEAPEAQEPLQWMHDAVGNQGVVQLLAAAGPARGGPDDPDPVAAAEAGVRGAGASLPFLDTIQAAFGDHDVSGIRAHTGGAAAEAAGAIGADAYATGSDVAFAGAPDLHTAAHEAAHFIQQQDGVSLKGGVGAEGDRYERHADAVADRVVRGQSAADLLDEFGGGGSGGSGGSPSSTALGAPGRNDATQSRSFSTGGGGSCGKVVQRVACKGTDNRTSTDHLQRILQDGDLDTVSAALGALRANAAFRNPDECRAYEVIRFEGSADSYELQLSADEVDAMVKAFARRKRFLQHDPSLMIDDGNSTSLGPWDVFAGRFNDEFATILRAFDLGGKDGKPDSAYDGAKKGEQSGASVVTARLQYLFTDNQRKLLMDFFSTDRIPDRLFNGDETGRATAQQRILMASVILARGTYAPGSFEQRVHARMCFHWAHIVRHYAGATQSSGLLTQGVMGNLDHAGNAVFGGGEGEVVYKDHRVNVADLPEEEGENGVGPLNGSQAETYARRQAKGKGGGMFRSKALPWDRFEEIQAGDWLYIYNANGSGSGNHSVVFSRWSGGDQQTVVDGKTVRHRTAVLFSQGSPAGGGREHTSVLGEGYYKTDGPTIKPIVRVTRVNAEAAPADTPEALLPKLADSKRMARLSTANKRFLAKKARRERPVDLDKLAEWLREDNRTLIASVEGHLTDGQKALLEETNRRTEIEALVMLNQKLVALSANAALHERNEAKTYEDKLDGRHAEISEKAALKEQEINEELEAIDAEMAPHHTAIADREDELNALDLSPQIDDKWRQLSKLRKQVKGSKGQERRDLIAQIEAVKAERKELKTQQRAQNKEIRAIEKELAPHRKRIRRLEGKRKRVVKRLIGVRKELPYGLVHPGSLRSQIKGGPNGRLEDLHKGHTPPYGALLVDASAGDAELRK